MIHAITHTCKEWMSKLFHTLGVSTKSSSSSAYSELLALENIYKSFDLYTHEAPEKFYTHHPIKFRGVVLNGGAGQLKELGRPFFRKDRTYAGAKFSSLFYKHKFSGYPVRAIVNQLNNNILNCRYKIDVITQATVTSIKQVIKEKYALKGEPGDHFMVIDEHGNQLIFNYDMYLNITYYATDMFTKGVVQMVMNDLDDYRKKLVEVRKHNIEATF